MKNWFVDEIFKVCLKIFFQIYTNHVQINCIYALLPNKTEGIYTRLLREVQQHVANSSTNILMDFEWAALNSVRHVYSNTELKDAFTNSHQIFGSIFEILVYRTTIKTMKTFCCGFICFLH